jgi:outer membrane protein TolC
MVFEMGTLVPNSQAEESRLVRLYMELTGLDESAARSVFMHVCSGDSGTDRMTRLNQLESQADTQPASSFVDLSQRATTVALIFAALLGSSCGTFAADPGAPPGQPIGAGTGGASSDADLRAARSTAKRHEPKVDEQTVKRLLEQPLSLADALNLALHHSPDILRAQRDLQSVQGLAVETRAIVLPTVGITGSYTPVQRTDVDIIAPPGTGFNLGTPQNWSSQVKLVQSLYEGGRMLSSVRVARLLRQQSWLNYQTALADTVLALQLAYNDVLLAEQQITVQEASVELLTNELKDNQRRYEAGTVPRFNVLRAEVELANARPRLITARNNYRIAKNNLANLMGFSLPRETLEDIPLKLSGKLEAEPYELDLPNGIGEALERRTELGALTKSEALRKEDLVSARSGYKPRLQGYVGYDVHNSILTQDLNADLHGWIAGVQMTWNIFDGLRTQGRVQQASAQYERAEVDVDDMTRRIELEVRTAYSNFIQAREVLESQKKVQEEAEESLRLARARSEAGTGTQLDVLGAQTALTEARTTQIQALHDYAAARARLQRALGENVPSEYSTAKNAENTKN